MASRKLESVPVSGEQAYSVYLQITAVRGQETPSPIFSRKLFPAPRQDRSREATCFSDFLSLWLEARGV